ncbi:MAG: homocysteine S-methyltransferase family protein [Desulfovibrio sp.]|nr:homocysteine S-methyltransferase family protein [Desulfovibrio sp.]
MNFRETLASGRLLLLDGAMGTMLQASGLPAGMSPERFGLEHPEVITRIHQSYLEAGCDIITSCTFGANPFKLDPKLDLVTFNRTMVACARQAARNVGREAYVAGNLGPSGHFVRPLGDLAPEALIEAYARQTQALVDAGCDLLLIETQFDLAEARALVCAVREVCDLPVIVSMTFESGLSLTGSTPEIFVETMQNLGVDLMGTNCSLGPDEMAPVLRRMASVRQGTLFAEPNAGLPELRGNETVFPLDAETFAQKTAGFADLGVQVLGGCCGTSPKHIACLAKALGQGRRIATLNNEHAGICLTSRSRLVRIAHDAPFCLIGERINPTGKKVLSRELAEHCFDQALRYADQEQEQGASVLDVNVGAPLVDETVLLPELTELLTARVQVPLALDSSNTEALKRALPYCPGSSLINSISGEGTRMQELGPLCRRYGAPFVLLPLQGADLPETAAERIRILQELLRKTEDLGIARRLILVDILALTVSANAQSARECLKVLDFCRQEQLPATLGLSNISFGLPARELLNATFLSMAAGRGLCSCIANPASGRVREAVAAVRVLAGQDARAEAFIADYANWQSQAEASAKSQQEAAAVKDLGDCVLAGDLEHVTQFVEAELAKGLAPLSIVQDILIPAITEVGSRYERKEYFLPQLIRSAETMQQAFGKLKPLLEQSHEQTERPVVIMATVEGDIHDIGKNIVSLMLSNHGFDVVDLGKDVPARTIVESARAHKASLIGLSALMTTTMVRMEDTVRLVQAEGLPMKVMVGGAAVTEGFAKQIGADGYSPDAVMAVRLAKKLVSQADNPARDA